MIGTAQLRIGFPTAIDGRIEKIVENLAAVRPTFVCAVPRIFEKVHAKAIAAATEGGGLKKVVFEWALGVGREVAALEREGKKPGLLLTAQRTLAELPSAARILQELEERIKQLKLSKEAALKARNAERAATLMQQHLEAGREAASVT